MMTVRRSFRGSIFMMTVLLQNDATINRCLIVTSFLHCTVIITIPPLHLSGVSECHADTHWLFYLHPHEEPLRLISEPMNNISRICVRCAGGHRLPPAPLPHGIRTVTFSSSVLPWGSVGLFILFPRLPLPPLGFVASLSPFAGGHVSRGCAALVLGAASFFRAPVGRVGLKPQPCGYRKWGSDNGCVIIAGDNNRYRVLHAVRFCGLAPSCVGPLYALKSLPLLPLRPFGAPAPLLGAAPSALKGTGVNLRWR